LKLSAINKDNRFFKVVSKYFAHPISLTIIFGLSVICFLPINFNKTNINQSKKQKLNQNNLSIRHDLNNDGKTEQVLLTYRGQNTAYSVIRVFDNNVALFDQWNIKGSYLERQNPLFGDYDNDGFIELYTITKSNDSLLLHGIEFFGDQNDLITNRFICVSKYNRNKKLDVDFHGGDFVDYNNDGFLDLFFILYSGLSKYPRNIFRYDINNDSLKISPFSGTGIINPSFFTDIDNDNKHEIFGQVPAYGNYTSEVPFKDSSSYLIVFSEDLELKFPPVEFKEYPCNLSTVLMTQADTSFLLSLFNYNGTSPGKYSKLFLHTTNGKQISELLLPDEVEVNSYNITYFDFDNRNLIVLTDISGQAFEIKYPLKLIKLNVSKEITRIKSAGNNFIHKADIDFDKENEIIVFKQNCEDLLVLEEDLSIYAEIPVPGGSNYPTNIFSYTNDKGEFLLDIQAGRYYYTFKVEKNSLFFWKYPIYLGIFGIIFLFFYFLNLLQKKAAKEKYEREKELVHLQYNSIKNQIEPHFIGNVISSISGLYAEKQRIEADAYVSRFTRILNQSLLNSNRVTVPLRDELDFTRDYIEIQQNRLENKFDFAIEVTKDVSFKTEIPRMLIHTFVENSIKHGLQHCDYKGHLSIEVSKKGRIIEIVIEDNGIGRENAKKLKTFGSGKGIEIVGEMLNLYRRISGKKIKYEIEDIEAKPNNSGFRVTISLHK
jgi:hypothetical protein